MRERILERVRRALHDRPKIPHPGTLDTALSGTAPVTEQFEARFRASGGEVCRFPDRDQARGWLHNFAGGFASVSHGADVPELLTLSLPEAPPHQADLGVSVARAAAAQSGSLVLSSRGGRCTQLLPPVHLVFVYEEAIAATLGDALAMCRGDDVSALALHSGPSKSADIGQVMVAGVHGPGRIIAVILTDWPDS